MASAVYEQALLSNARSLLLRYVIRSGPPESLVQVAVRVCAQPRPYDSPWPGIKTIDHNGKLSSWRNDVDEVGC
jgi:hypothetical protein